MDGQRTWRDYVAGLTDAQRHEMLLVVLARQIDELGLDSEIKYRHAEQAYSDQPATEDTIYWASCGDDLINTSTRSVKTFDWIGAKDIPLLSPDDVANWFVNAPGIVVHEMIRRVNESGISIIVEMGQTVSTVKRRNLVEKCRSIMANDKLPPYEAHCQMFDAVEEFAALPDSAVKESP